MRGERTFTTYLRIEPDKRNDQALGKFEQQAAQSLRRIQSTANQAGAIAAGQIRGNVANPAQVRAMAAAERSRGEAIQRTARAQRVAAAASQNAAGLMLRESSAARAAARETSNFERSLRLASIAANVAQGPLGPIAGRLSAMAGAVRELTGLRLGIVGIGAATAGFARFASTAEDLRARLYPLYETQQQVNVAFSDIQRIAKNAKLGLEPIVDLYTRLSISGKDVGLNQQRISRLTEVAAKAARLSGGSAVSQEAGLYQFAQGIASNTLAGDELKSVRENTIRLYKAIADGLDVPIGKLKKMGAEGELTADKIAVALERSAAKIDEEMAKLPPTISSASTQISNAFISLISDANQASGITTALAASMQLLADNLPGVARGVVGLTLAWAGYKAAGIIRETNQSITAFAKQRREIIDRAKAVRDTAQVDRKASAERITALRQERAALQATIRQEQALANERRRQALSVAKNVRANYVYGNPNEIAAYRKAMDAARVAQDNLAASKNRLRTISGKLSTEFGILTNNTSRWRKASRAASGGILAMGASLRGLLSILNPLNLALMVGLPLLIDWAFRQRDAAAAADAMAEAQSNLARFVDSTTGKIVEQNQALLQNQLLSARDRADKIRRQYIDAKDNFGVIDGSDSFFTRTFGSVRREGEVDQRLFDLRDQLVNREINAVEFSKQLGEMDELTGKSAEYRDNMIRSAAEVVNLAKALDQANAEQQVLQGDTSNNALERAFGPQGTLATPTPDNEVAAARTKRARATDWAAKAEAELQRIERRSDRRDDTLSRYDEQSSALDKAMKDARELNQMVGELIEVRNEFGEAIRDSDGRIITRLYTQEMADADREAIMYGVRQPIRDAIDAQRETLEIQKLRLQGYDDEAEALEMALQLQRQIGEVSEEEYDDLLRGVERQREINELLNRRQAIVDDIYAAAENTKRSFEDMLVGLRKDPISAIKNFGNRIIDNAIEMQVRRFSDKLFAGANEELRDLMKGADGFEQATEILSSKVEDAAKGVDPVIDANERLASATEQHAQRIEAVTAGLQTGSVSGLGAPTAIPYEGGLGTEMGKLIKVLDGNASPAKVAEAAAAGAVDQVITVVGKKGPDVLAGVPDPMEVFGSIFSTVGRNGGGLAGILGSVGSMIPAVGQYLAAVGIANSIGETIAGITGASYSKTGGMLGGIFGGFIGGLFKKKHYGTTSISGINTSTTSGSNATRRETSTGLAGTVQDQVSQIADALGADVGGFNVSIGTYRDNYRVSTTGRTGKLGGWDRAPSDVKDFGDDMEAAIAFAVADAIGDGAIKGISAASQRILQSGQDLQRAIEKAVAIESIPKRLMEKTDPVRYAVTQLNDEFTRLISYLQEGGATVEQYEQALQLYELERAEAIERATNQAGSAIQDFIDEITGGSSSPFNKATTYRNAREDFDAFREDIESGKVVDEAQLLEAARNFQNASSELNGSNAAFFADFQSMLSILEMARDNVASGSVDGDLPGNPFEQNSEVARILGLQADEQSTTNDILREIRDRLGGGGGTGGSGGSGGGGGTGGGAIRHLPDREFAR